MDETVRIPRNIKVREGVIYGLNGKQALYLAMGIGGAVASFSIGSEFPVDMKIAGSVASVSGSLFFALGKAHGQDLDRYVWNSARYPFRKKEYGGDGVDIQETQPVINIRYILE
jgi:hypothetical protein